MKASSCLCGIDSAAALSSANVGFGLMMNEERKPRESPYLFFLSFSVVLLQSSFGSCVSFLQLRFHARYFPIFSNQLHNLAGVPV
jgi:hypothetical protein